MPHATNASTGALQTRSLTDAAMKIRLTADQSLATSGILRYALDANERRHDDQEWFISNPVTVVLDLDREPDDDQYDSAVATIATVANTLATPSRAAVLFTVDEQVLLAALLDHAFYKDAVYDGQQWPIEAAAAALYPNLDDAPSAAQYDRAWRLLHETRARLEPLPVRPSVRVGDCLHACDLEELEENESGYRVVAVEDATVTVRDADGVDHEVSRAAIEAGDAEVVRYFGDFETQPDALGFREQREHEQEEWTRRLARIEKERRARTFANSYRRPHDELRQIDARIADCERLISGFRSGTIPSGDVERSVRKQQAKIAKLEAVRAETIERIAAQATELSASGDARHAAVLAWQSASDDIAPIARERNDVLTKINDRFRGSRAAADPDAAAAHHRDWRATMSRYQELINAASARAAAAFEQLVALC